MISELLIVVAGGSGGHMLPALTLAQGWQQEASNRSVMLITGATPLEERIAQQQPHLRQALHAPLTKVGMKTLYRVPLLVLQLCRLFCKSLWLFLAEHPAGIVTTGGIHAVPVCMAGWLARIPIDVYELNVLPGRAVQILKYLATNLFCVFPQTKRHLPHARLTDYPMRDEIKQRVFSQASAIDHINQTHHAQPEWQPFNHHRKTIFVLGGSQGSLLLNKVMRQFLQGHPEAKQELQIIHQTGSFEEEQWRSFYHQHGIAAVSFSYDPCITVYYQAADLIICRAGAGTLFEIAHFKRPCIIVPLIASSTDHQVHNAEAMAATYPALFQVIEQYAVVHDPAVLFDAIHAKLSAPLGMVE